MTASSTSGVSASDELSSATHAGSVGTPPPEDSQQRVSQFLRQLQDQICTSLTQLDGLGTFQEDSWERPEGGGGRSRVMRDGAVFEQGGVGFSEVWGDKLPPSILQQRPEAEGHGFYATGTSLVLHPRNPHVPTVHLNYRYFEAGPVWWFGGGADLTPYYPKAEDATHFHRTLKQACDRHHPEYYPTFKRWCDEYFYLKHRQETRGIGGIFFDYQDGQVGELYRGPATPQGAASFGGNDSSGARIGGNPPPDFAPQNRLGTPGPAATYSAKVGELKPRSWEDLFAFVRSCGEAFLPAYVPIVERRRSMAYGDRERHFQLYRRGRYVEFNLVYDRGTIFGLQTNGRTESILMSLPPLVRWEYGYQPEPNTPEAELYERFLKPQDWLSPDPF